MNQTSRSGDTTIAVIVLTNPFCETTSTAQTPHAFESVAALSAFARTLSSAQPDAWLALFDKDDRLVNDATQRLQMAIIEAPELGWIITDAAQARTSAANPEADQAIFQPDPGVFLLRSGFVPAGVIAMRAAVLIATLANTRLDSLVDWRRSLVLGLLGTPLPHRHLTEALLIQAPQTSESAGGAASAYEPTDKDVDAALVPEGLVSIIIPTRDQLAALQRCIESLFEHEPGAAFEIILVSHRCDDPAASAFIQALPAAIPGRLRVTQVDAEFNFAELCNAGAALAQGDFLLFMNDDVAALHPGWLFELLRPLACPQVGISAPRLVFPDGRLQHAGMVLGLNGAADFPFVGSPMDDPGYLGLLTYTREVSAVTAACMLVRRTLFKQLNGFDTAFALVYADVDFCIRATQTGHTCIWTPHATLMHEAGRTLKAAFATPDAAARAQARFDNDKHLLLKQWLPVLAHDPYHHPRLSLTSRRFEPETHPALQAFSITEPRHPRVLALPADENGSGDYRVAMPARAAAQHQQAACRIATGYPLPVLIERLGVDTLFSQRQVDDNHLTALARLRELMPRLRIVMDFDDLLTEVSPHSYYHHSIWKDMPRRLTELARVSDCFTVSTTPLAEAMRPYHANIVTIHNGIDPRQWPYQPKAARAPRQKLRVGWVGGFSHAADLALIRKVIATLAHEVEWVILGMCLEESKRHLHEFHPAVAYHDYPAKFASLDLDLALAPLEHTRFNECKSNLRLLENGILGIPVIATDITPYQCGLPVTLLNNKPQSWIRTIRERIGEFAALQAEGEQLRSAVRADWAIDRMLPDWLAVWR